MKHLPLLAALLVSTPALADSGILASCGGFPTSSIDNNICEASEADSCEETVQQVVEATYRRESGGKAKITHNYVRRPDQWYSVYFKGTADSHTYYADVRVKREDGLCRLDYISDFSNADLIKHEQD